jgi:hypothetical protein
MNLNELAVAVSRIEGGRKNLDIAEIKEVLSCLGFVLSHEPLESVVEIQSALIKAGAERGGPVDELESPVNS